MVRRKIQQTEIKTMLETSQVTRRKVKNQGQVLSRLQLSMGKKVEEEREKQRKRQLEILHPLIQVLVFIILVIIALYSI